MEDRRDVIVTALTKKYSNEWMCEDIISIESAVHSCNPSRENGWHACAVKIDGDRIHTGRVYWDFEENLGDASDYDWDTTWDFKIEETYLLSDTDDYNLLIGQLKI